MKKKLIQIPENVYHLLDFKEIQDQFPQGSFILDKTITGCGATTMFLADDKPTILCCPRVELMHCKANSPEFIGKVHEFRKFGDYDTSVIDLMNQTMGYITNCNPTPFTPQKTPKILVSYDSFKHVAQILAKNNMLQDFRIVVDEAQTVFTDAAFKGEVEIEFVEMLMNFQNVIYLSATPYIEDYLDQIDAFKNLPYVELVWPESSVHSTNIERKQYYWKSAKSKAGNIIKDFNTNGYFKEKMVNGQVVRSTEAVFYMNNVQLIISVITANSLTAANTNIICAQTPDNEKRLKKIGFKIGHAPKMGEQHKTFTFVTKCAFEGVDFYSTCAYTYIFSDISLKNMAIDISLDLPQIMGRQRLDSNPFRYDATFFYETSIGFTDSDKRLFENQIQEKVNSTKSLIGIYNNCNDAQKKELSRTYRSSQKVDSYSNNYVTVVDDTVNGVQRVVPNTLVMFNEIRAWDVQQNQYTSGCRVMRSVDDATVPITDNHDIDAFLNQFSGTFENRMRVYCDFLQQHPEYKDLIESLPQIPMQFKQYYNSLGPTNIRKQSYKESNLKSYISECQLEDSIKSKIEGCFSKGQFYSLKYIKAKLGEIYNDEGMHRTAKASDLEMYFKCKKTKKLVDGKNENGYQIF